MSDRWSSNGEYATSTGVPTERNGKSEQPNPESQASTVEQVTSNVKSTVGSWVKSAPGKSLLIALAAGLALGIWVKRS